MPPRTATSLVLACGAIAREIVYLRRACAPAARPDGPDGIALQCLPADWHNAPARIVPALRERLGAARADGRYRQVLIGYGDCGTGGALDALIAEFDDPARDFAVSRLPGAHCYAFFSGVAAFDALAGEEPGTFYLTDFLTRHFRRLVWQGLGLDRHPQLRDAYFGHYRRLVYLAQTDEPALRAAARRAARRLGLEYRYRRVGYGALAPALRALTGGAAVGRPA